VVAAALLTAPRAAAALPDSPVATDISAVAHGAVATSSAVEKRGS
jgi:hypothetical protein